MAAVTDCRWVLLYVKRWLQAPLQRPDGTLQKRTRGTPQGSAISPTLTNLFMNYAFDQWMVHQRLTHFEGVGHAGTIHLGVDIAHQVRLEVQVLDKPEGIVRPGTAPMAAEDLGRAVAAELSRAWLGGERRFAWISRGARLAGARPFRARPRRRRESARGRGGGRVLRQPPGRRRRP